MKTKGIILQASSRSTGNTNKIVRFTQEQSGYDVVDLNKLNIGHFDYDFKNEKDDFKKLIQNLAQNYNTIIFATPIYWYTMSGILKVFLDRISDCLIIDKETGRKLRGKSLGLLICGSDDKEIEGFDTPIRMSADYLGMNYLGAVHTWIENDIIPKNVQNNLNSYAKKIVAKEGIIESK